MTTLTRHPPIDVLIVDDDTLVRRSLRLVLEAHGFSCAEAADGRHAVELARRNRPPCILLDLCMPEPDGLTVARMLRADPRTSDLHVHALTGATYLYTRLMAHEAGFEEFLEKPLDPDALLRAVRRSALDATPPTDDTPAPNSVSGLTYSEAEGLLDCLQDQGCTRLHAVLESGAVTVSFVCPPGLRLCRDGDGEVRLLRG
jgi:CheY-like chemotaxis protein